MESEARTLAISCLSNTIWHYLDQNVLESAAFTAERLYAMDTDNPESKHLVGLVNYRLGKYQTAMQCTNNVHHLGCLYIYAQSCYKLKEYTLGISAIEEGKSLYKNIPSSSYLPESSSATSKRLILPTPAMVNVLLAHMYKATGLDKKAILYYGMALRLDPFCWEATAGLCQMGVEIKTSALYQHFTSQIFPDEATRNEINRSSQLDDTNKGPFSTSRNTQNSITSRQFAHPASKPKSTTNHSFVSAPRLTRATKSSLSRMARDDPPSSPTGQNMSTSSLSHPPPASSTPASSSNRIFDTPDSSLISSHTRSNTSIPNAPTKRATQMSRHGPSGSSNDTVFAIPRRSSRLAAAAATTTSKKAGSSLSMPPFSSSRFMNSPTHSRMEVSPTMPNHQSKGGLLGSTSERTGFSGKHSLLKAATTSTLSSDKHEALRLITNIYSSLTKAYVQFCKYQCDDALQTLAALPSEQANTPWVLAKQARMYFEKVQYEKSAEYFEKLRKIDRYRQEDMEYYSTLLWHLQRDVDLTFLASDLIAIDRQSSQAWCAVGNALSRNRDTENALKCFQRAVNLNPELPYPYTLQAHEYVASDAYEHAQDCYRLALRADKRHYNAWYGLGMVFLRLGNNPMAELHFRKAANINPVNVVLICCIGMVLEKLNRHQESLVQYTRATQLQPSSALSLFKRARLLVKLGMYTQALTDLNLLVSLAPDEASVHFLLGQIYKILKNRSAAVREFTIALNLDPKGSHMIKEALEGLVDDQQ